MIVIGSVNANKVGEHEPETLLAIGFDVLAKRSPGWNLIWNPWQGCWRKVVDSLGQSMYPTTAMSEADLAGVRIEEAEEPVYS